MFVFLWLLFSVLVGGLASSRGRSGFGFFLLAVFLSPLIAVIILLLVRNLATERRDARVRNEERDRSLLALAHLANAPTAHSIADELRKMHQLLTDGLLTKEEFDTQKQRLLSASRSVANALQITCARCGASTPADSASCSGCGSKFAKAAL